MDCNTLSDSLEPQVEIIRWPFLSDWAKKNRRKTRTGLGLVTQIINQKENNDVEIRRDCLERKA